jgi:AraC-like DNA-binding protein
MALPARCRENRPAHADILLPFGSEVSGEIRTNATPRTLSDYADRLERVAVYLAENLDRQVELTRLAEVACFSPFHFHRIYHALQGETVAETVRRMRLHRAAVELIEGESPTNAPPPVPVPEAREWSRLFSFLERLNQDSKQGPGRCSVWNPFKKPVILWAGAGRSSAR